MITNTNTDKLAAHMALEPQTPADALDDAFGFAQAALLNNSTPPAVRHVLGVLRQRVDQIEASARALEAAGRVQQAEPVGVVESALSGAGGFHCKLHGNRMPAVGAAVYLAAPAERAPAPTVAEPVAWLVCSVNSDGTLSLEHAAPWREAAHEHINDAITEHGIEGAASWVVRPAYLAAPAERAPAPTVAEALAQLRAQVFALHKDASKGDSVLRCGINGTVSRVLKLIDAAPTAREASKPVQAEAAKNPHHDYLRRYWQDGFEGKPLNGCTGDAPMRAHREGFEAACALVATQPPAIPAAPAVQASGEREALIREIRGIAFSFHRDLARAEKMTYANEVEGAARRAKDRFEELLRAALASPPAKSPERNVNPRLQEMCVAWGAYWRGSDAHGVDLTKEQAVELLQESLGVEVAIK